MTVASLMARVLYGLAFAVVIPLAMIGWARAVSPRVPLSPVASVPAGTALVALGFALMAGGIAALAVIGKGLPMNAFPPGRLVRAGIYRWVRNPIYQGFVLASAGVAIATGSAAGLWLVTPVAALATSALVFGYERHDLLRRFGPEATAPVLLSWPRADDQPVGWNHRAAVAVWVFGPWLLAFYGVQALGRAPDWFTTDLAFEHEWPVIQWTEAVYASTYLMIPLTLLVVRRQRVLRDFAVRAVIATAVITLCWLVIPVVAANRPFVPDGAWGRALAWEQSHSVGVAAFPAFHVVWPLIAARAWSDEARASGRPARRWTGIGWAAAITLSCLTTAMHTVIEVVAALMLYPVIGEYRRTWTAIRTATERLANSWREWRVGPVRIINHGIYAALAAGIGLTVAGAAAGREHFGAVIWIGCWILVGAGAWAQWLEGSSKLLRPFGWYGGVLGGVFGTLSAGVTGAPIVPLLAAFAMAAPWIQIFGRLRCLVQGCCHGGPAPAEAGIRYRHRRSRVTQLADLAGTPLFPTPLYSIAGNVAIGIILIRLRALGTADPLILGLYLILGGLARFVEESYRAEPQTRIIGGLHIYQWFAGGSLAAGICCTILPGGPGPAFAPPDGRLLVAALAMALVFGAAMGVDFPGSNRRFSRLAADDPL